MIEKHFWKHFQFWTGPNKLIYFGVLREEITTCQLIISKLLFHNLLKLFEKSLIFRGCVGSTFAARVTVGGWDQPGGEESMDGSVTAGECNGGKVPNW